MQAKPINANWQTVAALLMAVVGCYLFGHESVQLTMAGLASVLLNMTIAVTERVYLRWLMKKELVGSDGTKRELKINNAGMMLYQNFLGLLPVSALALNLGEYKQYNAAFSDLTTVGAVFVLLSCVVGVVISYAGFRLQRQISATAFMVTIAEGGEVMFMRLCLFYMENQI